MERIRKNTSKPIQTFLKLWVVLIISFLCIMAVNTQVVIADDRIQLVVPDTVDIEDKGTALKSIDLLDLGVSNFVAVTIKVATVVFGILLLLGSLVFGLLLIMDIKTAGSLGVIAKLSNNKMLAEEVSLVNVMVTMTVVMTIGGLLTSGVLLQWILNIIGWFMLKTNF